MSGGDANWMSVDRIADATQLDEMLSRPTAAVIESMQRLEGDLIVLGVGGKIGPSLARMARRASEAAGRPRRVIGVSRFSDPQLRNQLEADGIETICCDLLDRVQLDALPRAPNVLFLAARKFGSSGDESLTWAMNTYLPGLVAETFADARIVAYSSGNIYPLISVASSGSKETDLLAPVGEYAMSVLGRERIFTYFSQQHSTPVALVRLNYANEMRYGTLRDIGETVLAGKPVDVTMGYFNAIWQGDSNAMTLCCFDHVSSPPLALNVAGRARLSVREVAEQFGRRLGREVRLTGAEAPDALLSDSKQACQLFGPPQVTEDKLIDWIADWLQRGEASLGKPTHFQTRNGRF